MTKYQSKTYKLTTINDYAQAEKYKLKHENAGAVVKTRLNPFTNVVKITAIYSNK